MKLCLFCEYFEVLNHEDSECFDGKWQESRSFHMGCLRGAWSLDIERDTEYDLRRLMKKAEECDAYEEE